MFLMLQLLADNSNENLEGIYVNLEHISALIPEQSNTHVTLIILSNGEKFRVPFHVTEILEAIRTAKEAHNAFR